MQALGMTRARWLAVAVVALLVAGLVATAVVLARAGQSDAFVDSRPPPDLAERFYPPENWAWGLVQVGDAPQQRYGVGAPAVSPRADILILPDYGESAETWFETTRELTHAGYAVWVLEGVGAGGSARLTGHRDLGELRSFGADVVSVRGFVDDVIRPAPGRPLIVLGEGVGAVLAARAAETGLAPAGLILSAPTCHQALAPGALVYLGLGSLRAPGAEAWKRDGPDDFAVHRTHDRWRGAATHAWQVANPDLRLGGPSLDWEGALQALQSATFADAAHLATPTLVLDDGKDRACLLPPEANHQVFSGAGPAFELEADPWRAPWLTSIEAFIGERTKAADHASATRP
jgi:lysophospholipase